MGHSCTLLVLIDLYLQAENRRRGVERSTLDPIPTRFLWVVDS
jgi:hypothetical protein